MIYNLLILAQRILVNEGYLVYTGEAMLVVEQPNRVVRVAEIKTLLDFSNPMITFTQANDRVQIFFD